MPIDFTCPHCGHKSTVADQYAGQSGPCGKCGQTIQIPGTPGGAPPSPYPASPSGGGGGGKVIVIVAVIAALLLVCVVGGVFLTMFGIRGARESARSTASANNLHHIGIGLQNFHDVHRRLPAQASQDANGEPLLSWRVHLLPHLEDSYLYDQFHLDEPWDSPHNIQFVDQMPHVYCHPEDVSMMGKTRYLAIVGKSAAFNELPQASGSPDLEAWKRASHGRTFSEFTDGLSNTLIVIEVPREQAVIWTKPDDWQYTPGNLKALKDRIQEGERLRAVFADASVRTLSGPADAEKLQRLIETNDGQLLD